MKLLFAASLSLAGVAHSQTTITAKPSGVKASPSPKAPCPMGQFLDAEAKTCAPCNAVPAFGAVGARCGPKSCACDVANGYEGDISFACDPWLGPMQVGVCTGGEDSTVCPPGSMEGPDSLCYLTIQPKGGATSDNAFDACSEFQLPSTPGLDLYGFVTYLAAPGSYYASSNFSVAQTGFVLETQCGGAGKLKGKPYLVQYSPLQDYACRDYGGPLGFCTRPEPVPGPDYSYSDDGNTGGGAAVQSLSVKKSSGSHKKQVMKLAARAKAAGKHKKVARARRLQASFEPSTDDNRMSFDDNNVGDDQPFWDDFFFWDDNQYYLYVYGQVRTYSFVGGSSKDLLTCMSDDITMPAAGVCCSMMKVDKTLLISPSPSPTASRSPSRTPTRSRAPTTSASRSAAPARSVAPTRAPVASRSPPAKVSAPRKM